MSLALQNGIDSSDDNQRKMPGVRDSQWILVHELASNHTSSALEAKHLNDDVTMLGFYTKSVNVNKNR